MKWMYVMLIFAICQTACTSGEKNGSDKTTGEETKTTTQTQTPSGDAVQLTIAELFSNPPAQEGKIVRLTGECTKVNKGIMGRNWVHLKDMSTKNPDLDLTVTTNDEVELGSTVTMEGKIALNKDFGAGYEYALIMEDARVIK